MKPVTPAAKTPTPLDPHPFRSPDDRQALRIVPMGGCGEFGMNLTCYLTGGKLFVVDCGVRFPDPARLGVDSVLPNVDPWFAEFGSVQAYLLTHGHEDHLGAMPYILPRWPAPVYGTAWTISLLRLKLTKLGLDPNSFKLNVVEPGDRVATEGFDCEYVHFNHSIPMTCALFIRTPGLNIFHTGDFKFDDTPILEAPADRAKLAAIGAEGVDLLLADSTNAEKSGRCPSESEVLGPLTKVLEEAPSAVILSTFSSNLWRLKVIADACVAAGRRLYISGNGIETTLTIASSLNLYHLPQNLRVTDDQVNNIPRERLVVLATGCQGEWRSALARIANGEHRTVKIEQDDTVVLSSRIIPGNEKPILTMLNGCMRAGARVVTTREAPGIHVSGHAYGGDLEDLLRLLKPRHYLPVHGAFSQLRANLARPAAIGGTTTASLMETGDVLEATKDGVKLCGRLAIDLAFVDSDAGVVLPYETLRERLRFGELGGAIVSGVYSEARDTWLAPPVVELMGLKLPMEINEAEWVGKVSHMIRSEVGQLLAQKRFPADEVREEIRILVRRQLNQVLKKKPVVSVKVHFV